MNERNTDFVHPGCGGTFYEKADNVRLHGKFEPQFYTTDGVFIKSYLEHFTSFPKVKSSFEPIRPVLC